jgi:integrase
MGAQTVGLSATAKPPALPVDSLLFSNLERGRRSGWHASDSPPKEEKTGKKRRVNLNPSAIEAINRLLASSTFSDDDYLFKSQRARTKDPEKSVLTVSSVNRLVKSWCKKIHLEGNFGSHTLRKTFGYQQRVRFGVSIPELMEIFNHSSQKQTLTYLCIQPEERKSVYANEI